MHRSGRIVALVATIVLFCSGCDWLQWGSGATHRGVIFDNAITKAGVAGFVASTMLQQPTSSPTATAHDLLFVERDGKLTALDARSYAVVWTAILPSGTTAGGAPAISGSTVFVTVGRTGGPQVLGFDVDGVRNCNTVLFTCSPTYRAQLGVMAGPASPPVIDGGRVFVNAGSSLYALDAKGQTNCTTTGGTAVCNPLWSASTGTSASGIGPAVVNNIVYDAVAAGGTKGLGAFQGGTGNLLWTGDLGTIGVTATPSVGSDGTVFVPSGPVVAAFDGDGCGAASCARVFELAAATGDPLGDVFSTPAVDGTSVYATNARGRLYAWPSAGCGSASCQPSFGSTVDAPGGGATAYRQTPAISNGVLFLLAHRVVGGADHSLLLALDEVDASELAAFDLGTSDFGAGLANASIANAVIYAPLAGSLVAVHAPPVQPLASLSVSPLALSPAFSPSTLDYVVRCAAGTNQLTIDMAAEAGGTVALVAPITTDPSASQSENVQLDENQAAVIEATNAAGASARYWIRCLPHDFPPLNVTTHPGTGAPTLGWYLAGNNVSPSGAPSYAMILDINGTPVWYKRSPAGAALNVTPLGHDEVAFMAALPLAGYGTDPAGKFDVYNLDTNQTSNIRTVGVPTDTHELYQLANGNHLLLSYALKRGVDLTGLVATPTPGPNSTIADCVVQEVDPSGQLVWQWTASDHADPVTESTIAPSLTLNGETVYDVFHCNSIDPNAAGDVLVSARHLNAIVYVRRSDGKIVWKMGGKPVNKDGATIIQIQNDPEVGIVQQHDARFMPNNHVSLYDNQSNTSAQPARGVEYAINFTTNTAQPVFSFVTPTNAASCCMGSLRRLPDGHRVVGWGYVVPSNGAILTELDASGNDVLDLAFAAGYASYRAVKVPPPRFDVDALRATAGQ